MLMPMGLLFISLKIHQEDASANGFAQRLVGSYCDNEDLGVQVLNCLMYLLKA